jgi:excinuclease ABC subunit C
MKYSELKVKNVPDAPGVYFFMASNTERAPDLKKQDKKKSASWQNQVVPQNLVARQKSIRDKNHSKILYIGRATSLRDRVKSYFKDDVIHTRGAHIVDMVTKATDIETIRTDSVLEAIILEANLIKRHQPRFNTMEKDDKSFNYVILTREDFPVVQLIRGKELDEQFPKNRLKYVFGPYPHGLILREAMKIIRRIFPYRDSRCHPAGSSRNPNGRPCFNRQIGLCPGVCTGEISRLEYSRIITNIKLFFEGRKNELIAKLERQMKLYAKAREFEQANQIKHTIFVLKHIQDISLIKEEAIEAKDALGKVSADNKVATKTDAIPVAAFRLEAYDIAHMSGQNTAGVMAVFEDHHVKKSDYRMFKIRKAGINDVAALKEVLERRLNHPEWHYPNVIVVDGSTAQKNAAEEVLRERDFDIAVVAVVKNDRHQPDRILGDETLIRRYSKEILLLNSEAHRFAIKYHRKLRSRF